MPSPQPPLFAALGALACCLSCANVSLADELSTGAGARGATSDSVLANRKATLRPGLPSRPAEPARRPADFSPDQAARFDRDVEPATFQRASSADKPAQPESQVGRLSPPRKAEPLALAPFASKSGSDSKSSSGSSQSLITVAISLAVVLGLFFLVAWLMRRGMPKGGQALPTDVLEILGRMPLAGRQQLQLLRFGNKLLLVSLAPGVAETLAEISDPEEIDRLVGLCQQSRSGSATAIFRNMLQQISSDRKSKSPADSSPKTDPPARSVQDMLEEHDV